MLSNSEKKFTPIVKSTFQFVSVLAISQLLVSCCASQTPHTVDAEAVVLSKKVSSGTNQSKGKRSKRAVVGKPYQIKGKWYYPQHDPDYKRIGEASWYGSDFHGRLTANGEIYDMNLLTAAHPTMSLPSYARVTNLKNGASLIVRVNDRGPFMKNRIIDLSKKAAEILGYQNAGVTDVQVEYIAEAPVGYYDAAYLMASYMPGNSPSYSLALADIPKKTENILLRVKNIGSKERSVKASVERKQQKTVSIKLPEIGPVLVDKPLSFDQIASINSINKPNRKTKVNWLQLF
ncbi:Rare lipoprotein A precursor [Candidatus Bartonella washoeensis]|uniref:Endolytic peptidoglycan transglycosylase RlpA n=1 Tax=Candidatus Bartonella washoeensis Sb944nv TaxID=1094563 RepID=J0Q5R8_9HYPH|nr:septal ring lytic transglycosylase RlpA family protein [Bartonella washoeensis]EJF77959.1 rare lipoprotein A [Bartonella washoeensis Sb944nv]SPU27621.1 Rare lipoprotein A precursor [Bartonella washoeensis]